jgi:hypothetical protein
LEFFAFFAVAFVFVPYLDAVFGGESDECGGFEGVAVSFEESPLGVEGLDVDFVYFCDFLEGVADFEVGCVEGFVDGLAGDV